MCRALQSKVWHFTTEAMENEIQHANFAAPVETEKKI